MLMFQTLALRHSESVMSALESLYSGQITFIINSVNKTIGVLVFKNQAFMVLVAYLDSTTRRQ